MENQENTKNQAKDILQPQGGKVINHKEAQVIGDEGYLIQIPVRDTSLEDLSIEAIVGMAEKQVEVYKKVKIISLKTTSPRDWIDQGGKPYLTDDGSEAVANIWGVDVFGVAVQKTWSKDEKGDYYCYEAAGKAYSKKLRRYVEDIGACTQRDKFFGMVRGELRPLSEIDEMNIKKAAVTNLHGRLIKRVLGLFNVTYEDLENAGIDVSKIQKVEYGKGTQKAEKRLSQKALDIRKKLWDMCLELSAGVEEEARAILEKHSSFERDGKEFKVTDIKNLKSEGWINATYGRVKEVHEKTCGKTEEQFDLGGVEE